MVPLSLRARTLCLLVAATAAGGAACSSPDARDIDARAGGSASGGASAGGAPGSTAGTGGGSTGGASQGGARDGGAGATGGRNAAGGHVATGGQGAEGGQGANVGSGGQGARAGQTGQAGHGSGNAGRNGNAGNYGNAGGNGNAGNYGNAGGNGAAVACLAGELAPTSLAVRFADSLLSRWPDPVDIYGNLRAWEYNHGIVLRGLQQVWRHTCDPRYVAYIQKYADAFIDDSGTVDMPAAHSFDNIQPSVLLPFLYQQTGQAKYRKAADNVRARYDAIPVNADGGFWHKQTYPRQMWLDSIYMGEPFLAAYDALGTCGSFCTDTIFKQTLLLADHVTDAKTGLLYHAWDDSPAGSKADWADPVTGRSPVVWGRALGWYTMALVDMLPQLPAGANRERELTLLAGIAKALEANQDTTTGLWYEVVDQSAKSDNWVETSASGMFVYALKVGVARGYLDAAYLPVANRGWKGLQTQVTNDSAGRPVINGAVGGLSVQSTYAKYVSPARVSSSPHGLCAILLAASEMETHQ